MWLPLINQGYGFGESSLVTLVVKGVMRPRLSDDEICWRWKEEDRSYFFGSNFFESNETSPP